MIQGDADWLAIRCGRVTGSRLADVMAKAKSGGGWGLSRATYAAELIAERLTGCPAPNYVNDAMRWGTEQEPVARAAYCVRTGQEVVEVAFVIHPELPMAGASPDGLVGDDGLIEIKCPNTATHLDTLDSETVPGRYQTQIQWQLACTGRKWCDFVSFDPRLPEPMNLFIRRVEADMSTILDLETEVAAFIREIDARVERLASRYRQAAA